MTLGRTILLWTPVAAFMLLQFVLSSQSTLPGSELVWDKAAHVLAYGVLAFLCLRAFHGGVGKLRPRATLAAVTVALSYGAIDELHQSFVGSRHASWQDWVADAVGVGLAVLLVMYVKTRGNEDEAEVRDSAG